MRLAHVCVLLALYTFVKITSPFAWETNRCFQMTPHRQSRQAAETDAECMNRKLNFVWLAKHCSALGCRQEVCIAVLGLQSENGYFACEPVHSHLVSKWPRERISPSPAVFSNIVRVTKTTEDKRVRHLASQSSPSCGISRVSAAFCFPVQMRQTPSAVVSRMSLTLQLVALCFCRTTDLDEAHKINQAAC